MTESQRSFLTGYLGEQWKGDIVDAICERCGTVFSVNRTFTEPKDKQDLLEKVIAKGEWDSFLDYLWDKVKVSHLSSWLIQLSPEETAELICKWKGVE